MEESRQGDTYNEYGFEEDDSQDIEDLEEKKSLKIKTIYGIPVKFVAIGAIAVLAIIFLAVGLVFNSSGGRYSDTAESSDMTMEFIEPGYVNVEPQEPQNLEDMYIIPDDVSATDTVSESWSIESLDENQQSILRKYGYNADEIELAYRWGYDINSLVEAAKALQDEAAKEALERMSDTAGEEYKHLLEMTYLGQPEVTVDDQRGLPAEQLVSHQVVETINADYVKCESRGSQLYLKCKIGDDTYFWHTVTPQRWVTLPQSGNIVLKLTIEYYGDDAFIVDAVENDVSLDTVDASTNNG